jgi:hypothetical protein
VLPDELEVPPPEELELLDEELLDDELLEDPELPELEDEPLPELLFDEPWPQPANAAVSSTLAMSAQ